MVYQQILTNSETPSEGIVLRRALLEKKVKGLRKGIILPDNFIAKVEEYAERNIVHEKEVCPRCLKAFMLQAATEHELSESAKNLIGNIFPEPAGHIGYYLDENKVKPVQIEFNTYEF